MFPRAVQRDLGQALEIAQFREAERIQVELEGQQ